MIVKRSPRFREGDRVTGVDPASSWVGTVVNDRPPYAALAGCVLVAYDGGAYPQWMHGDSLRKKIAEPPESA